MKKDKRSHLFVILGVLFLAFNLMIGFAPSTLAQPAKAPDYKGKVITFMCESSPGGGTDTMARLFSRHLPNFIPGNPKIVIRNMTEAGQVACPNYMYNRAKPDGFTMQFGGLETVMKGIYQTPGVDYKLQDMPCLFGYLAGNVMIVKPQVAKKPADIMKAKGLVYGDTSPTASSPIVFPQMLLGFPIERTVWGYTTAPARLAFIQGEITCHAESILGYLQTWVSYVERGEAVPILQSGILDAKGNVIRDRMLPNVPTIPELYKEVQGQLPSGPLWEACKSILIGPRAFSKYLLYPPKTPEPILAIGRKAIRQMMNDKAFKEEAAKLSPGDFLLTEDAPGVWESVVSPPPQVVAYAKKMLTEKYGVKW